MASHPLRKPAATTAVLAVAYSAFSICTSMNGAAKASALGEGLPDEKIAVIIDLNFEPESFHMNLIQDVAQLARTSGRSLYLKNISRRDAERLLANYWIADARPWNGEA